MMALVAGAPLSVGGVFVGVGGGVVVGGGTDEPTVIENGPSLAVERPSVTVMTIFE